MSLAEAESALTCRRLANVLVASGLDGKTYSDTIRWFVRRTRGVLMAMLDDCADRQGQATLEAEASYVSSKPELSVAQVQYDLVARLGCAAREQSQVLR